MRSFLSQQVTRTFHVLERGNRCWSAVPTTPFLDPERFDWVAGVESRTDAIAEELARVQRAVVVPNFQDVAAEQVALTDDDRWKTYFLYLAGKRVDANAAQCPHTDAALRTIPGMRTAMFSILRPGKEIPPHRGPYNGVLRYHLGLKIPEPAVSCGIRVAGEERHWVRGSSLVFDDTFEHEAWNHSDEERVVLFVDFVRPVRFPMRPVNRAANSAILLSPIARRALRNLGRVDDTAPADA